MIKAVIFDYGGVIGKNVMRYVYSETAKLSGQSYEEARSKFHKLQDGVLRGQMPLENFWNRYAEMLNVNPGLLKRTWMETYANKSKIDKKVVGIVKLLKRQGYKLGLLSNAMKSFSDHRKEWSRGLFDVTIISHEVGMRKPESGIYGLAVKQLQVKASECIFVDDRLENIEGAEAAGLKGIVFTNAAQLKKDLKSAGVRIE